MEFKPHEYQEFAIDFLKDNPISCLLLDMGLGKTSITLTALKDLLDNGKVKRVLVIAPLRVARDTWPCEIRKWDHLKGLRYRVAVGNTRERLAALYDSTAQIVIINRENVDWLVKSYEWDFDMVVIDELSSFKNHKSKRFKAMVKMRPYVSRIVGLTGTPSSNGLMDLWAQFKILDYGKRLGRFIGNYREWYFRPDKMNGYIVYSYKPLPFAEKEIYGKISDITISMSALDQLDMPELITNEIEVEMSPKERAKYDELKDEMVMELPDGEISAANAASLTNKLCQMANGRIYDESKNAVKIHDRKLEALEDIIESANGRPLLVAYWFKHDLEAISGRFEVREIKTSEDIKDWNEGKIPVAVVHPASAGHGLNLQAGGNTLVWYGLTWSLELYQQTNARLWRQGQKAGTVVIQHIICRDTVDGRILKALKEKDTTQSALIDAVKAVI